MNDQQFFRREEAAEFLRVSLSTIDRMLKCGDLKKTYLRPRVPLITRAQLVKRVRLGG
jgi:predicted DNA-binding transcriptional regulator AlpA